MAVGPGGMRLLVLLGTPTSNAPVYLGFGCLALPDTPHPGGAAALGRRWLLALPDTPTWAAQPQGVPVVGVAGYQRRPGLNLHGQCGFSGVGRSTQPGAACVMPPFVHCAWRMGSPMGHQVIGGTPAANRTLYAALAHLPPQTPKLAQTKRGMWSCCRQYAHHSSA